MERHERRNSSLPTTPSERAAAGWASGPPRSEHLLANFTHMERQRLRYLRQLYEPGKLTEFLRQPRD